MKLKNRDKMCKRSQEEILGFVLIVLLVAIIALVFLAIQIRKPAPRLPSTEVESFLQASMQQSTGCFITSEQEYKLKDVIVSCAETNEKCLDGRDACQTLNQTALVLLDRGLNPGAENPVSRYKFGVYRESNSSIFSAERGNCTGNRVYSDISLFSFSERVRVELEICTNS